MAVYEKLGWLTRSATMATWVSQSVKLATQAIILPIALSVLPVEEASLWLLFFSFTSIGLLADFGFAQTFIRFVSYANSRSSHGPGQFSRLEDFSVEEVVSSMRHIYVLLSALCVVLLATFGTMAVARPISLIESEVGGWLAWLLVIVGTVASLYNVMYGAFLQGRNQIAVFRQWEACSGLVSIVVVLLSVTMSSELVVFVAAIQSGPLIALLASRRLARRFGFGANAQSLLTTSIKAPVVRYVWNSAWRSGLGVMAAIGSVQTINIVLAQVVKPDFLAPFLLAQRLIAALVSYASAPFYTGIPRFVGLLKSAKTAALIADARRRFILTNWLLVVGLSVLGLSGPWLLRALGSDVGFVSGWVWLLLSAAAVLDRIGAMHLQLYSLTNHILWHIANGVTGLLLLLFAAPLYLTLGVAGVAWAILLSCAFFYVPYTLHKSYREYGLSIVQFDVAGSILPGATLVLVLLLALVAT